MNEPTFPISPDGSSPHLIRIPWSVAEKAYSVYAGKHGFSQSLERIAERGGFGAAEMDKFYPKWREESDEITRLRHALDVCRSDAYYINLEWCEGQSTSLPDVIRNIRKWSDWRNLPASK